MQFSKLIDKHNDIWSAYFSAFEIDAKNLDFQVDVLGALQHE